MTSTATRFAQVSYRLFAHEGTFRIEVPDGEDFEATAREFERVGCSVVREPESRCLTVTCPARSD